MPVCMEPAAEYWLPGPTQHKASSKMTRSRDGAVVPVAVLPVGDIPTGTGVKALEVMSCGLGNGLFVAVASRAAVEFRRGE